MTIPTTPDPELEEGADLAPTTAPPDGQSPTVVGAQRKTLLWSMLIMFTVLFATYAGVIAILLPAQVEQIDPANKVNNLAIVMSASSFATLFAQPIVGAFSDRTRSKLGRRSPYILIGAVIGGLLLMGMPTLHSILFITIAWVVTQISLNALQGPASTIIADRFEMNSRGTASAMMGVGTSVGMTIGMVLAGQLVTKLGIGYTVFGGAVIVVAFLFVFFNRDYSSKNMDVEPMHWGKFVKSFWVSPRKHPDYGWAFAGRFVMILGYQAIQAYMLYILIDYLGMTTEDAGQWAGILAVITAVTMVVSTLTAGKLSDKLERRKIFVFSASMFLAGALVIPVVFPNTTGMMVYAALAGLGFGAYSAVDMALMVDVLPSQGDAGKDLGVLNIATNIPQALSPIIAAFLLGTFGGNYAAIFIFAIIMVAASSFLVLPIKSVR